MTKIHASFPLEFEEQCNLIKWCHAHQDKRLRLIYSHTNGARMARGVANKLKASGAKAGIPDLFLPIPNGEYHGLYIELKRIKNSTTSLIQKKWLGLLIQQGYQALVCFGAIDAQAAITNYLTDSNK
mgnify:CR=1 FL=1